MRALPPTLALCALLAPAAAGAVVRVRLQVDPPAPAAGEAFRIVYGISAQNESRSLQATALELPGLRVLSNPQPPSTGDFVMFGGGGMQMSLESNVEYVVVAPRAGRFTVRNAAIIDRATGQVVARHEALTVTVGPPDPNGPPPSVQPQFPPGFPQLPGFPGMPGMAPPPPPPAPTGPDVPPDGALTGAVYDSNGFIRVVVDRPTPWVGEPIQYRAWAYLPAYDAACEPVQEPTVTGFWSESLLRPATVCAPRWLPVSVNGNGMGAGLLRHLALYPTRAGESQVGPLVMNLEFIVGDPFFGSRRQVRLSSPAITVTVRETPSEGRPRDYVPGTLGPLALEASFDRPTLTTGETATLRLRIHGNGYIGSVTLPPLPTVEGLRFHPGSSRVLPHSDPAALRAVREDTIAVVPQRAGRFALGTWEVPFFDPGTGRYARATVALPALEATGAAITRDDDSDRDDPTVALDPFDPTIPLEAHRTVFTSALRVWGAVALPGVVALALGLFRALRALRAQRRADDQDRARTDPTRLLDAAERALAAGELRSALEHLGRAIALVRKANDDTVVRDAQTEADTLRFAGDAELRGETLRALLARVRPFARAPGDEA